MSRYLPRYQHFSQTHQVQKDNNKKLQPYRGRYKAKFHPCVMLSSCQYKQQGGGRSLARLLERQKMKVSETFSFVHSKATKCFGIRLTSEDLCSAFLPLCLYGKMKINKKTSTEMTIECWCTNHRADQGAFWCTMEWSRSSLMSELRCVLSLLFTEEKKALMVITLFFPSSVLCFNHRLSLYSTQHLVLVRPPSGYW